MKAFAVLFLSTLVITACANTPSGRNPAAEIALTEMTKGPDAGVAPVPPAEEEGYECRPFKRGDIRAGAPLKISGILELNPIAAEALREHQNAKNLSPAQLKEIKKVMYVLIPFEAPHVGFFTRTEPQACRPKKFTLSLESAKEIAKAKAAFENRSRVEVSGRAAWPESSVELINNGMIGAARIR